MPRPLRALVLGAGGYAAMSWEVGFLAGMADSGTDPRDAERVRGDVRRGDRCGSESRAGFRWRSSFAGSSAPFVRRSRRLPQSISSDGVKTLDAPRAAVELRLKSCVASGR